MGSSLGCNFTWYYEMKLKYQLNHANKDMPWKHANILFYCFTIQLCIVLDFIMAALYMHITLHAWVHHSSPSLKPLFMKLILSYHLHSLPSTFMPFIFKSKLWIWKNTNDFIFGVWFLFLNIMFSSSLDFPTKSIILSLCLIYNCNIFSIFPHWQEY